MVPARTLVGNILASEEGGQRGHRGAKARGQPRDRRPGPRGGRVTGGRALHRRHPGGPVTLLWGLHANKMRAQGTVSLTCRPVVLTRGPEVLRQEKGPLIKTRPDRTSTARKRASPAGRVVRGQVLPGPRGRTLVDSGRLEGGRGVRVAGVGAQGTGCSA